MVNKVDIPDWETMFYAVLESAETGKEVKLGNFTVKHKYWCDAELCYEDDFNCEFFSTWDISILCCEDEEEYAGECASTLLEKFEKWYERQPVYVEAKSISDVTCWAQAEPFVMELNHTERLVYENCCDYLYYGEGFRSLIDRGHNYDVSEQRTREIWKLAFYFMAEGCMEDDPYTTSGSTRYVA